MSTPLERLKELAKAPVVIYLVGREESKTYGHGCFGSEKVVTEVDGYNENHDMHPAFASWFGAYDYIKEHNLDMSPIEVEIRP